MALSREQGLNDLFYFARDICGLKDLSEGTHRPICDRIKERLLGGKRIAVIIPRDHFKSSLGLATCLWMFTRRAEEGLRDYRVLIDTATLELSMKHVMWIGGILKNNENYRQLYGDMTDRKKGARVARRQIFVCDRPMVHKEPNFAANGIGAEVTGMHFDLIWHDDLIGERNWHTPALRQKAYDHYEATESLLDPEGVKYYTATRWHDGDVTGSLIKGESEKPETDREWEFYIKAAVSDDGKALFPERWSLEKLNLLRGRITAFKWASQYMNDPVLKEFAIELDPSSLYRPMEIFPRKLRLKTCTIDPNFRDEQQASGDFGCFVVGGFDQFMHWWGLDVQMGKWTASEFIDKIFEIHKKWNPDLFKIERKFTSFLQYAINDKQAQLGVRLPITWIDRDNRSKETRYACLEPIFRAKKIKFNQDILEKVKRELEDELSRCGYSAHDDFLDALSDQFEKVNPVLGDSDSSETVPVAAHGQMMSDQSGQTPKPKAGWMWGRAELDD